MEIEKIKITFYQDGETVFKNDMAAVFEALEERGLSVNTGGPPIAEFLSLEGYYDQPGEFKIEIIFKTKTNVQQPKQHNAPTNANVWVYPLPIWKPKELVQLPGKR